MLDLDLLGEQLSLSGCLLRVTLGALSQDQCLECSDVAGKILRISEHMGWLTLFAAYLHRVSFAFPESNRRKSHLDLCLRTCGPHIRLLCYRTDSLRCRRLRPWAINGCEQAHQTIPLADRNQVGAA